MKTESGPLSGLLKALNEQFPDDETIDGVLVSSIVGAIDLEVAGVPLCLPNRCDFYDHVVPEPQGYEKWDSGWVVVRPQEHDFDRVSEDVLKRMRARFLLLNSWYYKNFHSLSHPMQCDVMRNFLQHTFGAPPMPGSPLAKILGLSAASSLSQEEGGAE